ncbi:MAG TPA: helix-turn-helix domain-containing protein [Dysgonomonas sp.]|uniref:helix-turn-helix domain-containing protein n=1 Tax=unclassified Dysgonomonas TaxID=2630389 RepID=UPI0025C5435B|nr:MULTISPECIES: helix-turn-helix domain-containing protein [unclassified Dysgonomonas]HML66466.1 helix-turn-helix domain-containing protein [Dysgonomonas sp.]
MSELKKSNNKVANLNLLIENVRSKIEKTFSNYKPLFNGERYLTDFQLSKKLNISRRTLQAYRDKGLLSYIPLEGKILYKESDIEKLLEKNYLKAWKEE